MSDGTLAGRRCRAADCPGVRLGGMIGHFGQAVGDATLCRCEASLIRAGPRLSCSASISITSARRCWPRPRDSIGSRWRALPAVVSHARGLAVPPGAGGGGLDGGPLPGLPDRQPWAGVDWDEDPDWEFRTSAEMEPEQLRQRYREACDRSRLVVSQASGLGEVGEAASQRAALLAALDSAASHRGNGSPCGSRGLPARSHRRQRRRVEPSKLPHKGIPLRKRAGPADTPGMSSGQTTSVIRSGDFGDRQLLCGSP